MNNFPRIRFLVFTVLTAAMVDRVIGSYDVRLSVFRFVRQIFRITIVKSGTSPFENV